MDDKKDLLDHLARIHTTEMGADRIIRNLKLKGEDHVSYCIAQILDPDCAVTRKGKNFYCRNGKILITVNAGSLIIITARLSR